MDGLAEEIGKHRRIWTNEKLCNEYCTFGDCCNGLGKCRFIHKYDEIPGQEYFAAIIKGNVPKYDGPINIERWRENRKISETYHLRKGEWFSMGATKGDLVIFQASDEYRRHSDMKYGRVFAVLGRFTDFERDIPIGMLKTNGFTLDPPGCKYRNSAFTVDACKEHGNDCVLIGIHIAAACLGEHSKIQKVPGYKNEIFVERKMSFRAGTDQVYPAISVYVHSSDKKIHGPIFTPVMVHANYAYNDHDRRYAYLMTKLWSRFVGSTLVEKIAHTGSFGYLMQNPSTWKEFLMMDEVMAVFASRVTKYIVSLANYNHHNFITKSLPDPPKLVKRDRIVMFADYQQNAELAAWNKDPAKNEDFLILVAAGKKFQRPAEMATDYFPPKYQSDVELGSSLSPDSVIKCTSPYKNVQHFLNQQILLRCMVQSSEQAYTAEELKGILGIRYITPILRKSFVKAMRRSTFLVECTAEDDIDQSRHEFAFSLLHNSTPVANGVMQIMYKNVFCDEEDYCHRAMVGVEWEAFEDFVAALQIADEGCDNSTVLKQAFEAMVASKIDMGRIFQKHAEGTSFKLQENIELQLQISSQDYLEKNELGLRLMRIGRNCHLCLTHLNRPEMAFISDRRDVRQLISVDRISKLKEAKTDENLTTTRLTKIKILWRDRYFSGGCFDVFQVRVTVGSLLCICKEITKGENVRYVWNCHAVVSHVEDATVTFDVCTLSQADEEITDENFCVELM